VKSKFIKYFATIAEETAKLSSAKKLKVGCVIVKDNRILSIGYNGTPSGWDNECEADGMTKPEVLHAEANALMKLAQSTESSKNAVLFVTHTPCIECAKLIYQAGIKEVYYINEYNATKGCGQQFLEKAGVEVCQLKQQ
jgi:dCMP deaminase